MKKFLLSFLCSLLLAITSSVNAQTWSAAGSGVNGGVSTLAVYNGELYAGAIGVSKWNGTNWTSVSTEIGVNALTVYNGNLYAGGSMYERVIGWNGTNWFSTGGNSIVPTIATMNVYNGVLYAAGTWWGSGTADIPAATIKGWNGASWSTVSGVSSGSQLRALATYNGQLYVGGDLENNMIGGITAHGIAGWNGTSWSAAGTGAGMTGGAIFSLCVFNGELYAGGEFTSIGNIAANSIAKWNGTSWAALGTGITGTINGNFGIVSAMASYNGELYAAGSFNNAGGNQVNNIARWNGTSWSACGSGTGYVSALAEYANELYAGGGFSLAGNIPVNNIARWSTQCYAFIAANGSPVICSGTSVRLDVFTGTGASYQWQFNGGNIAGATSSSYFANAAGNYSCNVTSTCGTTSATNTIAVSVVSVAPPAIITANGATTICAGAVITLDANTGAGLSYQWKLNGTNISGRTASSLPVASSGNYSCLVSNPCGSATSNSITVTVNPNPTATITAAGPTTFCSGGSVTMNANTGTGLTYQWKRNTASIIGATSSAYVATTAGTYTCVVSNSCGSATSNSKAIVVNAIPVQPGSISGPASVCHNQNNVIYSIAAVASATSYTWTVPQGVQIKSGQGTLSIKVRFGHSAGSIAVRANNSCGSGTLRTLAISMPCRETETGVAYDILQLTVFPNPSQHDFTFRLDETVSDFYAVNIIDMTGRVVESYQNIPSSVSLVCGEKLADGIYSAEIIAGSERKVIRLVKQQ